MTQLLEIRPTFIIFVYEEWREQLSFPSEVEAVCSAQYGHYSGGLVAGFGPGSPSYTMGARLGYSLKSKSPGPAVYFQHDTNLYKTRSALPVHAPFHL